MNNDYFDNSFAYASDQKAPWAGVGVAVNPSDTVDQWLEKANLDSPIVSVPIPAPEGADPDSMKHYRAIMRERDGRVYQIASDRYKPTQTRDMVEFFRRFCESGDMRIDVLGAMKGGARVWALAKMRDDYALAGGDKTGGYCLLANSHDGTLALVASMISVRFVCMNMLGSVLGRRARDAQYRMTHRTAFDAAQRRDAERALGLMTEDFARQAELSQELAESRVGSVDRLMQWVSALTDPTGAAVGRGETEAAAPAVETAHTDGADILAAALDETEARKAAESNRAIAKDDLNRAGKRILDAILRSPGSDSPAARGTWYGAVNGVTYYADHAAPTRNGRERMDSAVFGVGARLKERAVTLATQYARAS